MLFTESEIRYFIKSKLFSPGLLCCFVTVIFFAAPLTMLLHVIKIKNVESLPFPLILSNFFVSLEWFVYGCLINDAFLQVFLFLFLHFQRFKKKKNSFRFNVYSYHAVHSVVVVYLNKIIRNFVQCVAVQ